MNPEHNKPPAKVTKTSNRLGSSDLLGRRRFASDYLPPGTKAVITKSMQGAYGVWFSVGELVTITGADYGRKVRNIKRLAPISERRELNELVWADVQNLKPA